MSIASNTKTYRSRFDNLGQEASAGDQNSLDFVATLAHEMRNIPTPLSNAYQLLNLMQYEDAAAQEATNVIGRQIRQLKRLTSDLLDAHRLSHDDIPLVLRRTDLREVMNSISSDYRAIFNAREITLIPELIAEPAWAQVDRDRLDQVLNNLLSNSLKFTDRGGSVRLGLAVHADCQQGTLSVTDSGVGMSRDVVDTIFTLHAHEHSYRNRTGLGLGLPLAKQLVELHGGRLEVQSTGPGQGTTCQVVLPLCG